MWSSVRSSFRRFWPWMRSCRGGWRPPGARRAAARCTRHTTSASPGAGSSPRQERRSRCGTRCAAAGRAAGSARCHRPSGFSGDESTSRAWCCWPAWPSSWPPARCGRSLPRRAFRAGRCVGGGAGGARPFRGPRPGESSGRFRPPPPDQRQLPRSLLDQLEREFGEGEAGVVTSGEVCLRAARCLLGATTGSMVDFSRLLGGVGYCAKDKLDPVDRSPGRRPVLDC